MIRYLTDWVRYVGTGKLLVVHNLSPELRYLQDTGQMVSLKPQMILH